MISRVLVVAGALVVALAIPAMAGDGPGSGDADNALLRALSHCATLENSAARLACYDGLAPRVNAALGGGAPAKAAVASKTPTKEEQSSWFGFDVGDLFGTSPAQQTTPQQFGAENTEAVKKARETPPPGKPKPIDSITAGVTEYAYNPFGKFIVFLDNGQIWKQLQGDSDRARFKRRATDNTVKISRGFLGSYNLSINGSARIYKVTRVK